MNQAPQYNMAIQVKGMKEIGIKIERELFKPYFHHCLVA